MERKSLTYYSSFTKMFFSLSKIIFITDGKFKILSANTIHEDNCTNLSTIKISAPFQYNPEVIILNPLPNNATFWRTKDIYLWKRFWEKQKLLVTSNFSFSHNVFYPVWHIFFILNALSNVVCNLKTFREMQEITIINTFYISHTIFYHSKNKF